MSLRSQSHSSVSLRRSSDLSLIQTCLVSPLLFVQFFTVFGQEQMAGEGGWEWLIKEPVPALRVQPLLAPLTPLTRGYTGPPRHKCLRKPLQGRRCSSDRALGRRSGQPLQRLGPLVCAINDTDRRHCTRACGSVQDGKEETTYR